MAEIGWVLGGRYQLLAVLGQGGMATIYRAYDGKLGREVAVKVLRAEYGADAEFVERFRREAQAAASLSHPNIVPVHDFGTDPAGPYIVMELVSGGDLAAVLRERGPLPPTAVARSGQQVADALAAAHARGIVHRDIKPSNILLAPDGRVLVADFGIAQALSTASVTAPGVTMGSAQYLSPEQTRGEVATGASDVYALGLVMYEMLTGQRAFAGESPASLAVARLANGVPSPQGVRPDVPPALDAIVRWCLNPDPRGRPSAAELSATLGRFLADPAGTGGYATAAAAAIAAPPSMPPPTTVLTAIDPGDYDDDPEPGGTGRWGIVAAILGLLVIVAAGVLVFMLFSGMGNDAPTPSPTPSATAEIIDTPDFVGQTQDDAEAQAEEAGLSLDVNLKPAARDKEGLVLDQLPEPGEPIAVGNVVRVDVGTRKETVPVPDLLGLSEDDALAELDDAGLLPGDRSAAFDPEVPRGFVSAQDPTAGVAVVVGASVDYTVSRGEGQRTPRPTTEPTATPKPTKTPRPTRTPRPTETPTPTEPPNGRTPAPTTEGTPRPTEEPTTEPTEGRTPRPTTEPEGPTAEPTEGNPTDEPTAAPSEGRTPRPTEEPTAEPTEEPTTEPTPEPTPEPTAEPTPEPTAEPTPEPTAEPTSEPTAEPTPEPTAEPSPSPAPVLVGNYECLDLGTARGQIESSGLIVSSVTTDGRDPDDSWLVHDQLPAAGDEVPVGSSVALVVGDPLDPCPAG